MLLIAHNMHEQMTPVVTSADLFRNTWNWDPLVLVPLLTVILIYLWWVRFRWNKQTVLFLTGNLMIFAALLSPIADIGETYLFSVHMMQHLLLTLVAVPLLLLGVPKQISQRLLRIRWVRRVVRPFGNPIVAWVIGVGTLWVWHLPPLYNRTLENEWLHAFEHICFVLSATIFWNAVLDPIAAFRLKTGQGILYIFSAGFVNSVLAILITFAPPGLYPYYSHPVDRFGALDFIRNHWGIDVAMDQQMGGALMWIMGGVIGVLLVIGLLAYWFRKPEHERWQEATAG